MTTEEIKKETATEGMSAEEVMKKFDSESDTRDPIGAWHYIISGICIAFALFQLYTAIFGVLDAHLQRGVKERDHARAHAARRASARLVSSISSGSFFVPASTIFFIIHSPIPRSYVVSFCDTCCIFCIRAYNESAGDTSIRFCVRAAFRGQNNVCVSNCGTISEIVL